jgi:hypothetical protein
MNAEKENERRLHVEKLAPMVWIEDTLYEMRAKTPQSIEEKCPHCGLPVRYPLIARQSDIDLFVAMMAAGMDVMQRHGIVGHLLNDVREQCLASMKGRGADKETDERADKGDDE